MSQIHGTQNNHKPNAPAKTKIIQQSKATFGLNEVIQRLQDSSTSLNITEVQFLQHSIGNQAVERLLSEPGLHQTPKSAPSSQTNITSLQRMLAARSIQAKLTVNAPNDPYEKEADTIAKKVISAMPPLNVKASTAQHHKGGSDVAVPRLGARTTRGNIQRSYLTLPIAFVGNDAQTAHANLLKYIKTEPVATDGKNFQTEYARVLSALEKMQPTKAAELTARLKSIGMDLKNPTEAVANAAKLESFVNFVNGLAATFQLDTAPAAITARVEDDGSHHMDYFFKLPGDDIEKKFDLDEWSRKGNDFLHGASSGATIKGIVDEAVNDWDTKSSIVSLLVARLLGTGALGGTAEAQNVSALFMNSPVGPNYTKILMATEHILGVRTNDLKPRGVKVQHWKKTDPNTKDNNHDGNINWPSLLKTARIAFKEKMKTTAVADQPTARKIAVKAIAGDSEIIRLNGLRVLQVDDTDGTFALDNKPQKHNNDIYQVLKDERFNFDINHFTAILFFEWKAVTDLKQ